MNDAEGFDALGLQNLVAVSETISEDGVALVEVKSREEIKPICCLAQKLVKNGRKAMQFRDYPRNRYETILSIKRQRWKCHSCGAVVYEELPDIDTRREMTKRMALGVAFDATQLTFVDASRINGLPVSTVRRVFLDHAEEQLADYRVVLPRVLGIDEKVILGKPRLVIGDVERKLMLDMMGSRRNVDLDSYFTKMVGCKNVAVVCQDMWKGYERATRKHFPNATTVIDKFHVVRMADHGLGMTRKRISQSLPDKDRVYLKRRIGVLKARWHSTTERARTELEALFSRWPELQDAYDLKEAFYGIYNAPDRETAEDMTDACLSAANQHFSFDFKEIISAYKGWRPHILNYFEHPYTNAYTERLNGLIGEINMKGKGYDLETLRAKALLKYSTKSLRRDPTFIGPLKQVRQGAGVGDGRVMAWRGFPISTWELLIQQEGEDFISTLFER
ncbi:ISL3 family transposase [Acetobacter sp. P1H12_c]|uniref:ISL3 family transposase n=1 Tax=Acetobacter sp. P1H12_c TaxID=2762621 RepID=UPI001C04BD1D|nr:ISL3 family transposase [Acetobacter sp. P1H12_c]